MACVSVASFLGVNLLQSVYCIDAWEGQFRTSLVVTNGILILEWLDFGIWVLEMFLAFVSSCAPPHCVSIASGAFPCKTSPAQVRTTRQLGLMQPRTEHMHSRVFVTSLSGDDQGLHPYRGGGRRGERRLLDARGGGAGGGHTGRPPAGWSPQGRAVEVHSLCFKL